MPQKKIRHTTSRQRRATSSTRRVSRSATRRYATSRTARTAKTSSENSSDNSLSYDESKGEINLTRRHFLYGVAGVAAVAVVGGSIYAVSRSGSNSGTRVTSDEILAVASNDVFTTEECTQIDDASSIMTLVGSQQLDYGTLIWATDDAVAACLLPTDTVKPLTQIGLLALDTGTCTTIVKNAVSEDEGFEIYDVRASSNGIIWVESNILQGTWRIYHATLNNLELNSPVLAAEGNADWEMPTLAAVQNYAFWQVVPRTDGAATQEDSKLYRATFGSNTADEIYVSHGRMACEPYACENGIVIAPRADDQNIYYQLTYIDAASAQVFDTLVLPASMKPLEVGYGKTGFSFTFDAIYNYGEGISNLGTYTAAEATTHSADSLETAASYSSAQWFRYPRTPTDAPAWCNDWFIVKSTSAVCGVNLGRRIYFALDVEEGADDYGDYLATSGTRSRIVTYSNIDYTTIDGEYIKHCLVRIWQPTGQDVTPDTTQNEAENIAEQPEDANDENRSEPNDIENGSNADIDINDVEDNNTTRNVNRNEDTESNNDTENNGDEDDANA